MFVPDSRVDHELWLILGLTHIRSNPRPSGMKDTSVAN